MERNKSEWQSPCKKGPRLGFQVRRVLPESRKFSQVFRVKTRLSTNLGRLSINL